MENKVPMLARVQSKIFRVRSMDGCRRLPPRLQVQLGKDFTSIKMYLKLMSREVLSYLILSQCKFSIQATSAQTLLRNHLANKQTFCPALQRPLMSSAVSPLTITT